MKKFFLATAALALTGLFFTASAGSGRTDREAKKQQRKEKRELKREEWLHAADIATRDQFDYDFPNAKDVIWTRSVFTEASFTDGDIQKIAYYDTENNLVGTTRYVDYSVLPAKAQRYISKKYKGYRIDKVILFDDNEANDTDMFLFNASFEDEDSYFPVLSKDSKQVILKVTTDGNVSFFRELK